MDFKEGNWKTLLPPGTSIRREPDDNCRNLKCQVTPNAAYSWVYHGTVKGEGKPSMITLGRCDDLTATVARAMADKLRVEGLRVFEVKDKAGRVFKCDFRSRAQRELDNVPAPVIKRQWSTIEEVWTLYKASDHARTKKGKPWRGKTLDQYEQLVGMIVAHAGADTRASEFTGKQAATLLGSYDSDRGRAVMISIGGRLWEYLATLEGLNTRNPWAGHGTISPNRRTRKLEDHEYPMFAKLVKDWQGEEKYKLAWHIFLAVAMRHENLCHAKWEWFDFDGGTVTYPRGEHKSGDRTDSELVMVLCPHAISLLRKLHTITGHTPWLYPGRERLGQQGIPQYDLATEWDDLLSGTHFRTGYPETDLRIHDLRRSLTSEVSTQGDKRYVGEILGHVEEGATDIYARTRINKLIKIVAKANATILRKMKY